MHFVRLQSQKMTGRFDKAALMSEPHRAIG